MMFDGFHLLFAIVIFEIRLDELILPFLVQK